MRKTIQICGRQWRIYGTKNNLTLDGADVLGYCDVQNREIHYKIDADANATLLHELIHATLHEYGFGQTSLSRDLEELICEAISRQFDQIFNLKIKNN